MARSITPPVNKDTLQRNNCNPSTKGRTRLHNGPTASLSSLYPTPLSLLGNRQRQPRSRRLSCPVTRLDRNIRLFTARTHSSPPTTTASRASTVRAVSSEIIKILVRISFFFLSLETAWHKLHRPCRVVLQTLLLSRISSM